MSEEHITKVTLAQVRKMKSKTDWARVRALTDEDIDSAIADDPDAAPIWTEEEWARARVVWPEGKEPVTLRLDRDVLAWFKHQGRGYQTRINAVLRSFVEAQKPRGWRAASGVPSQAGIGVNQPREKKKAERR